jgi:glycine/D-amino acid oxidase-like deaminating enzyme
MAPGAFSNELAAWLGVAVAVEPLKGQLLRLSWEVARPPVEVAWGRHGIYPIDSGAAWVGGTEERATFDSRPTDAARDEILEALRRLIPNARQRVTAQVAGLRPLSADGLPLVGLVPGYANAVFAGGAGRKGMLYGPGLGKAAADLATTGVTALPVDGCRIDRPGVLS